MRKQVVQPGPFATWIPVGIYRRRAAMGLDLRKKVGQAWAQGMLQVVATDVHVAAIGD